MLSYFLYFENQLFEIGRRGYGGLPCLCEESRLDCSWTPDCHAMEILTHDHEKTQFIGLSDDYKLYFLGLRVKISIARPSRIRL